MAAISVSEDQIFSEEAVNAMQAVLTLYILAVHYPKVHAALMWGIEALEYAERVGSIATSSAKQLLRAVVDAMVLEAAGITDMIESLL